MKIKVLAEGSTKWQRLIKHWGLSILVDDDILFDTFGKPGYILMQMKRFHIDPYRIRDVVISHDDWDHIAGLPEILELGNNRAVYICPNSRPEVKAMIRSYGANIVEADKPFEIRKNIYVSGELKGGARHGAPLPEQYLAIKTLKGLIVITGCAHPGIVEIAQHARMSFDSDIRLLIGGFHLKDNPYGINMSIVKRVKELGVRQVMPFHCTGKEAQDIFRKEYGGDCIMADEGKIIDI